MKLLKKVKNETPDTFIMPKADDEWKLFHKTNEDNMQKAYQSKEGYYKDKNKLYIAGTRDFQHVLDWRRIPLGTFKDNKI